MEGTIFNIQRFSTHDGPGIRTTVFMKGCPLKCLWCHNPEGLSKDPDLIWIETRCIDCGECIKICPKNAIIKFENRYITDKNKCNNCRQCVDICPAKARDILGRSISALDLLNEVKKDFIFYKNSGGGITLSGGEPCKQDTFINEFLELCLLDNLHTAIDTSGYCPTEKFKKIIKKVSLVLFDLKIINSKKHIKFTNVDNRLILKNYEMILDLRKKIWIRIPVIPGHTDHKDNIISIANLLKGKEFIERVELIGYHNLAEDKYRRIGREYPLSAVCSPLKQNLIEISDLLKKEGVICKINF